MEMYTEALKRRNAELERPTVSLFHMWPKANSTSLPSLCTKVTPLKAVCLSD